MEKYPSNEFRESLAKDLKAARKDLPEGAHDLLDKKREEIEYKISALLKEVKSIFPPEVIDFENKFTPNYESIENNLDWESVDISRELSQPLRLAVEASYIFGMYQKLKHKGLLSQDQQQRIEAIRKKVYSLVSNIRKEIFPVLNKVTEGNFSNPRNFTHVVSALGSTIEEQFDVASQIREGIPDEDDEGFFMEPGENVWLKTIHHSH